VRKVNKILVPVIVLLVLCVVAPVGAKSIGPQNAVKNPHIMITPQGVEILLPSGGIHEWVEDTESGAMDFVNVLDASKVDVPNAMPISFDDLIAMMLDPEAALEAEHLWAYVSYNVLVEMFMFEGFTREQAEAFASPWPEGVYVRFVNVGPNWNS